MTLSVQAERTPITATTDHAIAIQAAPRTPLLRVTDVAARLRISPRTVRQWRADRVLPPCLAIAGVVRWREADIDEWLRSRVEVRE